MSYLLLVEDDESLGQTLKERLEKEGYKIQWAKKLSAARQHLSVSSVRLVILDVGLPDGSGFEFAKEVQKKWGTPLIFLTAQTSAEDRLQGYELGAIEFIPKPFHLKEMLIRLQHALSNHTLDNYEFTDGSYINFSSLRLVDKEGHNQELNLKEMRLLRLLITRSPIAISRNTILDEIWGEDQFPNQRTIDNVIVRLRQLLGPSNSSFIRSVRGVGYQWLAHTPKFSDKNPSHGDKNG